MNQKFWIFIQISLKFVPKGPVDNKSGSGNGSVSNRQQSVTYTNADPVNIYYQNVSDGCMS